MCSRTNIAESHSRFLSAFEIVLTDNKVSPFANINHLIRRPFVNQWTSNRYWLQWSRLVSCIGKYTKYCGNQIDSSGTEDPIPIALAPSILIGLQGQPSFLGLSVVKRIISFPKWALLNSQMPKTWTNFQWKFVPPSQDWKFKKCYLTVRPWRAQELQFFGQESLGWGCPCRAISIWDFLPKKFRLETG